MWKLRLTIVALEIQQSFSELFYADRRTDGRTDMTKLIVAFSTNAPGSIRIDPK